MDNIKVKPVFKKEHSPKNVTYADGSPVEIIEEFSKDDLKKDLIIFIKDSTGKEMMFKCRTVQYEDKTFISPFPNPVHLLLKGAIENYNHSIEILKSLQFDGQHDNAENQIYMLNLNENFTNSNYDNFVRLKITSIITLVASIETFLNQIIPNNFVYNQIRNGKTSLLNKEKIESTKVSFKEKLTEVISQVLNDVNFEKKNSEIILDIISLYAVRKDIIHLKTNSEDELGVYFKAIGNVLDLEVEKSIESTIKYMNIISKDFIK